MKQAKFSELKLLDLYGQDCFDISEYPFSRVIFGTIEKYGNHDPFYEFNEVNSDEYKFKYFDKNKAIELVECSIHNFNFSNYDDFIYGCYCHELYFIFDGKTIIFFPFNLSEPVINLFSKFALQDKLTNSLQAKPTSKSGRTKI